MKPSLCRAHGIIVYSGECPECVSEGVAVLSPATPRTPWQRELDRVALLYRLSLVRIRERSRPGRKRRR